MKFHVYLACTGCSTIVKFLFNRKISKKKNIQLCTLNTLSSVFKIQTTCFLCVNRLWTPSATLNIVNLEYPQVWNFKRIIGHIYVLTHSVNSDYYPRSDDGVSRLVHTFSPHSFVDQASGRQLLSWICSLWLWNKSIIYCPTWRHRLGLISTMSFPSGPTHPHWIHSVIHRK